MEGRFSEIIADTPRILQQVLHNDLLVILCTCIPSSDLRQVVDIVVVLDGLPDELESKEPQTRNLSRVATRASFNP